MKDQYIERQVGQEIVTLFAKPEDQEDGELVSQITILSKLEFRLFFFFFFNTEKGGNVTLV